MVADDTPRWPSPPSTPRSTARPRLYARRAPRGNLGLPAAPARWYFFFITARMRSTLAYLLLMMSPLAAGQKVAIPSARIIGGQVVQQFEFPFLVRIYGSIVNSNSGFCGASLIANDWILTAAHCFQGRQPPFHAGIHRDAIWSGATNEHACAENIQIAETRCNPSFGSSAATGGDICLARLVRPITCSTIPKARLDDGYAWPLDSAAPQNGGRADVMGWGQTSATVSTPSFRPQSVWVNLYTRGQCRDWFSSGTWNRNLFHRTNGGMQCAGRCALATRQ